MIPSGPGARGGSQQAIGSFMSLPTSAPRCALPLCHGKSEFGDVMLLFIGGAGSQAASIPASALLLEDGSPLLTEDGDFLLLESGGAVTVARKLLLGVGRVVAGGTVPGATPAFGAAGTASSAAASGTLAPAHPATVGNGDIALVIGISRGTGGNATETLHADAIADDWDYLPTGGGTPGRFISASGNTAAVVGWRRCDGTEDSAAMAGGVTAAGTINTHFTVVVTFTAADGFATNPFESLSLVEEDFDTSFAAPSITPTDVNRLGVSIFAAILNLLNLSAFTGESGGDFVEVLDIETSTGGDATIQIQTADLSAGDPISGGSATSSSNTGGGLFGFALVPADVPG